MWREDAVLEDADVVASFDTRSIHSIGGIGQSGPAYEDYTGSVYWYTQRNLTSDSDMLNAFAGISRVLLRGMGEADDKVVSNVYGLPSNMFDWALLWSSNKTTHRRAGGWPSWSWCGWVGGVGMALTGIKEPQLMEWLQLRTRVWWRTYTAAGWPCECINSPGQVSVKRPRPTMPTPQQVVELEEAYLVECVTSRTCVYSDVSSGGDTLLPLLHIGAQVAHFQLLPIGDLAIDVSATADSPYHITLAGRAVGGIWLERAWSQISETTHDFIVMSEARMSSLTDVFLAGIERSTDHKWDGYHVMLVKSVCDNRLWERVAIGTVLQSAVDSQSESDGAWQELWLR